MRIRFLIYSKSGCQFPQKQVFNILRIRFLPNVLKIRPRRTLQSVSRDLASPRTIFLSGFSNSCAVCYFWVGKMSTGWISGLPTSGLPSRGQSWGWAILSPSVIRIAHPKYYVILCNVLGPGWVLGTHAVSHITIPKNEVFPEYLNIWQFSVFVHRS